MFGIIILVLAVVLLAFYLFMLKREIRNIKTQLNQRSITPVRQPIHIALFDRDLNQLTEEINKTIAAEEKLRIESVREEKKFKELIANISHDLRTPLTAIKGYQQLLSHGVLSKEQRERLTIAQKHADDLGSLIEHFFEYTYLVNAEPKVTITKVNVTNVVLEGVVACINEFEKANRRISFTDEKPIYAKADVEMLNRIVQNLIRNSLAHSQSDLTVHVSSGKHNVTIAFSNEVEQSKNLNVECMFDRFYTNDPARGSSTGLGLSIVKLLAEQMDGSVSAQMSDDVLTLMVKLPCYTE